MIILLRLNLGLRINEIANLEVTDIDTRDEDNIVWLLRKGHKAKDEYIILNDYVYGEIMMYIGDRTDGRLFTSSISSELIAAPTVERIITDILDVCGIKGKGISPHSLRHTAAIKAYKAGAGIMQIKISLGHKNISTTAIYLALLDKHDNPASKQFKIEL